MDWTSIIIALLGCVSVGSIYEAIRWRKENKRMKENEVKKNDVETQTAQIDYADRYFNGMLELLDKVRQSQDKGETNQGAMLEKLDKLDGRTEELAKQNDRQDGLLTDIVGFLNGDFQQYLTDHHQGKKRKGGRDEA